MSDGGPENKGNVLQWITNIKAPPCVKKITAKTDVFPHSNSMIEGSFHLFKHDFLKGELLYDGEKCDKKLNEFMAHCLNRYFGELHGLTPQQVLDGETPNKHKFKDQIAKAKKERIEANKTFSACATTSC